MKREKGITLVALVITVIVLIILAAVSIKAVMNGGLIINAKTAKEKWETGETEETGKLASLLAEIEGKYVESENGQLTLQNSTGKSLKNYRIYGNTVDGESVGDRTKNLFNSNYMSISSNYTLTITGGYKGVALQLKPNTTYTLNSKRTEKTDTPSASFWYKVNTTATSSGSHIGSYNSNNDTYYFGKATATTGDDGLLYIVMAGSLKNIYEYFNEFQLVEGTTLPDYEPYGYKIPVRVSGKNLFDFDNVKGQTSVAGDTNLDLTNKSIFLSSANNLYIIGQSFSGAPTAFEKFNEVLNITEPDYYCLKVKINAENNNLSIRSNWRLNITGDGAKEPIMVSQTFKNGYLFVKFQITEEILNSLKIYATSFRLYIYSFIDNTTKENVDVTVSDFLFVKGDYTIDTMPEYEPYQEPDTTNIYLNEPLRKIGEVADYIDFKNQKVVRYIKEENGELSLIENGPIEEAIELPQIPTFEGATYLTVDTTVLPSKLEVNYESN